jgi:hypothetical protein
MKYDHHCRELLAIFLRKLKAIPARWTRIILSNDDAISSDISDGLLSTVMRISYAEIYIQFMQRCGLVKMQASRRWGTTKRIIDIMAWESFVAENKLQGICEVGSLEKRNDKAYYLLVGTFKHSYLTIKSNCQMHHLFSWPTTGYEGNSKFS